MSLPNILSIVRILLTPLFIILLLKGLALPALFIFLAAGISDALDGFIARYFDQRTLLGAYLDPIADKLLLTSAFAVLALLHIIPEWLSVIVLTREAIIFLGVIILAVTHTEFEVRPRLVSKCTTVFQISTVLLMLLDIQVPIPVQLTQCLFWFTAGLTIVSGLYYIYIGMNILQAGID